MSQRFGGGKRPTCTPSLAWSCAAVLVSFLAGASIVHNVFKPDLTLPSADGVQETKSKEPDNEYILLGFVLDCCVKSQTFIVKSRNLQSPDGNGGYQIPRGFFVQYCHVCKLHYRDLPVTWLQYCNTDSCNLCLSCGCCSNHD
ncbi:uncharacterized protein LOC130755642 isoform X1 [Actinidia eriantha]|uniref:uncharacterized protein LOC130755642 isoform X1 n=1 Tax=Actinidia eriantha TaxID=165200 RepID=UPI002590944B|nr:uncharacterized protein LOC130755642 isoform X1 [Actinidia eriantha]